MMIKTGNRKEGRLAGGAVKEHTYSGNVFGKRAYGNPVHANRPGGLIDKRQQIDPSSTTFGHPFDGGEYRSTATRPSVEPKTGFNVINQVNPLKEHVPEVQPNAHGAFFDRSALIPIVKTQFGAARTPAFSGPTVKVPEAKVPVNSTPATEKVANKATMPSFASTGNLWGSGNHSFIAGRPNTISGQVGTGRWNTTKRSAV